MKTWPENLRSLSIALLAAAIAYLGYALIVSVNTLSSITERVSATTERITPVLTLAPRLLEQSERLRQTTESAVAEVASVRAALPSALEEVKATRETIPSILEQTERMRLESQAIRKEVALIREQIPPLLAELEAYRAVIPQVLAESERIRQTIPPVLDRVEGIVAQADEVASTAGENVFTGMISGIVKAPFKLIGSATSAIIPSGVRVSDTDKAELEQRIEGFIGTAAVGATEAYVSKDGTLTWRYQILGTTSEGGDVCRELGLVLLREQKQIKSSQLTVCLDQAREEWYVKDAD